MQRSIDRDYDINYHKRALDKCLEELLAHAQALHDVGYNPYYELDSAEDQIAIAKHEV
jgi:hypothetical protein